MKKQSFNKFKLKKNFKIFLYFSTIEKRFVVEMTFCDNICIRFSYCQSLSLSHSLIMKQILCKKINASLNIITNNNINKNKLNFIIPYSKTTL